MSDRFSDRNSTLVQALNPGDTTVFLDSVTNYTTTSGAYLGIHPFENYPEYTYTRTYVRYNAITPENNSLTLISPYSSLSMPAGTKVAQHKSTYGSHMYSTAEYVAVPSSWTCYSAEIYGQAIPMTTFKQWRYGTRYIRIMMLLNYAQDNTYSVLVDNLKLELISNQ